MIVEGGMRVEGGGVTPPMTMCVAPAFSASACTCGAQIVSVNCLDLYHESPDSGELLYKSRTTKRRFDRRWPGTALCHHMHLGRRSCGRS